MNIESTALPAIRALIEPGDGYRYLCIMAGGAIAIHCPGNGVSFTDDGYGVRSAPPPLSWCQMRVGLMRPKTARAVRLRLADVLHTCLLLQHEMTDGGGAE